MISPETIKKLHELNCEDVARRLGLEVNMHQAHCFMHQDKRPSLAFKNNLWKCFACDKGGDAISLVEEKCNLSFVEACTWLCEQYHIYTPSTNLKNTKRDLNSDTEELLLSTGKKAGLILMVMWLRPS